MFLMSRKIGHGFKNCRFLRLIPPFLDDKIDLLSVKNHRFLREKARNEVCFCSWRFPKRWFYAMWTWQIIVFGFLFHEKSRRWIFFTILQFITLVRNVFSTINSVFNDWLPMAECDESHTYGSRYFPVDAKKVFREKLIPNSRISRCS